LNAYSTRELVFGYGSSTQTVGVVYRSDGFDLAVNGISVTARGELGAHGQTRVTTNSSTSLVLQDEVKRGSHVAPAEGGRRGAPPNYGEEIPALEPAFFTLGGRTFDAFVVAVDDKRHVFVDGKYWLLSRFDPLQQ